MALFSFYDPVTKTTYVSLSYGNGEHFKSEEVSKEYKNHIPEDSDKPYIMNGYRITPISKEEFYRLKKVQEEAMRRDEKKWETLRKVK